MYVKYFIVNVNKCLKPFFQEQNMDIVNKVTLQTFFLSVPDDLHEMPSLVFAENEM